jgi:hypothetical protein
MLLILRNVIDFCVAGRTLVAGLCKLAEVARKSITTNVIAFDPEMSLTRRIIAVVPVEVKCFSSTEVARVTSLKNTEVSKAVPCGEIICWGPQMLAASFPIKNYLIALCVNCKKSSKHVE